MVKKLSYMCFQTPKKELIYLFFFLQVKNIEEAKIDEKM